MTFIFVEFGYSLGRSELDNRKRNVGVKWREILEEVLVRFCENV